MSVTYNLFQQWMVVKGHKSERAGCLALGASAGAVAHWKAGRNAEEAIVKRMAVDLGLDWQPLVLQSIAEQRLGKNRQILLDLSKRFAAVAGSVVLLGGTVANLLIHNGIMAGISHNIVYIMSRIRGRKSGNMNARSNGSWMTQTSRPAFS